MAPSRLRTKSHDAKITAINAGWARLFSDFEASMQARGLALRTVEHYSQALNRVLLAYCQREDLTPADLTKRHLERLAAELLGGGRSRQTVKTYMTAVNTFLAWCKAEGELEANLAAPRPTVDRRVLDVLSRQDVERLEDAAATERDKLIVRVLADCGLRLGELRRLTVDDLVSQGRERYLRICGSKSHRDRLVPLTAGLYMRLDRYARRGRPASSSDRLFLTLSRGRSGDHQPLGESTLEQLVGLLGRKAGLRQRVHPHLLRHSFATELLRRGVNPIQVRDILGHTSLAMIDRVYSHLTTSDAHRALIDALRARDDG